MRPFLPTIVVALLGCAGAKTGTNDEPIAPPSLQEARRLLDEGSIDEALRLTDRILADDPNQREAHRIAAEGNFALFQAKREGAQLFLLDAIRNLETAQNLDPSDGTGWSRLAEWHLANGDFEAGVNAGLRSFRVLSEAGAPDADRATAMIRVADNQLQQFVVARREEIANGGETRPGDETKLLAKTVLASAQAANELGAVAEAARRSARVYRWLNRDKEALETLERAIVADPAAADLHEEFRDIYFASGGARGLVGAYRRLLKTHGEDATLLWYLGRAQAAAADDRRRTSNFEAATKLYEDALETFSACASKRPAFADSCAQWRAICELSLGRVAFDAGRNDEALSRYEHAFDIHPSIAAYDDGRPRMWDGLQKHYLGNLCMLGQRTIAGEDGLERGLAFYERILERHPDEFGVIYNNAALCARDLGAKIAEVADTDRGSEEARRAAIGKAMALWEKSYDYYEKAVALESNDPRIVNDCGLMLLYHLHRDYDRARACFDRAIELGESRLAELDEDASDEKRFLEEAVGDAYENIGVLLERLNKPLAEAESFYERAVGFYPGDHRAAARRLDELRGTARDANADRPQDPRKRTFDARVKEAVASAEQSDWDGALLVLDKLAKEMKGYAPWHFYVGLYSLRYAQAQAQSSGDAGLIQGLFDDAVAQLRKACEIDPAPIEPRLRLAEALNATGAFAESKDVLEKLVGEATLSKDEALTARGLLATAAAQVYISARNSNQDDAKALETARSSFAKVEAERALTPSELSDWVNVERWAGDSKRAIGALTRACRRAPNDGKLIDLLVTTGYHVGENEAVIDVLADRDDAFGLWYCGKARYYRALAEWSGSRAEEAIKTFDRALGDFDRSKEIEESYAASCDEWAAFCLGSRGLAQISIDRHEDAKASLLAALERKPSALASDLGNGSIKRGIMVIGHHYFSTNRLKEAADLYIAVGKLAPDDVDLANNEGLFARDLGAEMARSGEEDAAKPYFEASYAAYTRASTADPTNVRLRNDRALLLIYHLGRDLDLAKQLLDEAIADGETRLEDDPPEDTAELRDLQEAVGDCYQNLGVYHMNWTKRLAEARAAFEKSLTFYPFQQRASARHLSRLGRLEREQEQEPK
ncbi:MAG: hypothetical protein KDB80_18145 [Planctomycetes bacterium]|nr:hypothetical protein [Planctomycetota bacterium]